MDGFEWNKIFGAVCAVALFMMGLGILSEVVFHEEAPEKAGYIIEVADVSDPKQTVEAEETPIAVLLASADAGAGEKAIKKCTSCHVFEKGGVNKVGPKMWDVVNRAIGAVEGFAYSGTLEAMKSDNKIWDFEALNGFLKNPRKWAPGTSMGFAGIKKDDERANVIAYLQTLSDTPVPLPALKESTKSDEPTTSDENNDEPTTSETTLDEARTPDETNHSTSLDASEVKSSDDGSGVSNETIINDVTGEVKPEVEKQQTPAQ